MTLEHQGGPMTAEEARTFQEDPQFDAILRMRRWDERAKDPNAKTPPLEHYKDVCLKFLRECNTGRVREWRVESLKKGNGGKRVFIFLFFFHSSLWGYIGLFVCFSLEFGLNFRVCTLKHLDLSVFTSIPSCPKAQACKNVKGGGEREREWE